MARRRYTRRELELATWHHWDPREYSSVYVNNDMLRHVNDVVNNPPSLDPEELLRIMRRIVSLWTDEHTRSQRLVSELIEGYNRAVDRINEDIKEIDRLNHIISQIRAQLAETAERQRLIQEQIDEINQRHHMERARAVEHTNRFVALYNELAADTSLHKFVPEALQSAKATIDAIQSGSCDAQAVQALAINGLIDLQTGRKKAEKMRMAFMASLISVTDQLETAERVYEAYASDTYFDRERQHQVDMDYWSHGDFSIEYSELKSVRQRIDNAVDDPTYLMDQLIDDLKLIDQLRKNAHDIYQVVTDRAGVSETIEAHGLLAAAILAEDHMFELVAHGYQDNDYREPYVLQMARPISGQSIELVLLPATADRYSLQYHISFDYAIDEAVASQIIQTLISEMRQNDIKIEPPQRERDISSLIVDSIEMTPHDSPIHLRRLEAARQ